jgi:hypothetical protein
MALDIADEAFDSVSCMHVIEHIGLGRYGDTRTLWETSRRSPN